MGTSQHASDDRRVKRGIAILEVLERGRRGKVLPQNGGSTG